MCLIAAIVTQSSHAGTPVVYALYFSYNVSLSLCALKCHILHSNRPGGYTRGGLSFKVWKRNHTSADAWNPISSELRSRRSFAFRDTFLSVHLCFIQKPHPCVWSQSSYLQLHWAYFLAIHIKSPLRMSRKTKKKKKNSVDCAPIFVIRFAKSKPVAGKHWPPQLAKSYKTAGGSYARLS